MSRMSELYTAHYIKKFDNYCRWQRSCRTITYILNKMPRCLFLDVEFDNDPEHNMYYLYYLRYKGTTSSDDTYKEILDTLIRRTKQRTKESFVHRAIALSYIWRHMQRPSLFNIVENELILPVYQQLITDIRAGTVAHSELYTLLDFLYCYPDMGHILDLKLIYDLLHILCLNPSVDVIEQIHHILLILEYAYINNIFPFNIHTIEYIIDNINLLYRKCQNIDKILIAISRIMLMHPYLSVTYIQSVTDDKSVLMVKLMKYRIGDLIHNAGKYVKQDSEKTKIVYVGCKSYEISADILPDICGKRTFIWIYNLHFKWCGSILLRQGYIHNLFARFINILTEMRDFNDVYILNDSLYDLFIIWQIADKMNAKRVSVICEYNICIYIQNNKDNVVSVINRILEIIDYIPDNLAYPIRTYAHSYIMRHFDSVIKNIDIIHQKWL